jgi:hypothetical protein
MYPLPKLIMMNSTSLHCRPSDIVIVIFNCIPHLPSQGDFWVVILSSHANQTKLKKDHTKTLFPLIKNQERSYGRCLQFVACIMDNNQSLKTSKFSPQKFNANTLSILARCLMLKQQLNLWIYGVVVWM